MPPDPIYGITPLDEIERAVIEHAIKATRNLSLAAQLLGIGRTTMYRKLRRYKLPVKRDNAFDLVPSSPHGNQQDFR